MLTVEVQGPGTALVDGEPHAFATLDAPLSRSGDPWVAVGLPKAMREGRTMAVTGDVSPLLLSRLPMIQRYLASYFRDHYRIVKVLASPGRRPCGCPGSDDAGDRVGALFSGGVDAWYTVLTCPDVDTLVTVVGGFDVYSGPAHRGAVAQLMRSAAAALGKDLVTLDFTWWPLVSWSSWMALGPSLAAVALSVAPRFRRIYWGSTYSAPHAYAFPHSTHPLIDPLWSTERLEIVHHGVEATRMEKMRVIARSDVALRHLRVCEMPHGEAPNCNVCRKCVQTKLQLYAVGALDRAATFDGVLDAEQVAGTALGRWTFGLYWQQIVEALPAGDPMRRAAEEVLLRHGQRW